MGSRDCLEIVSKEEKADGLLFFCCFEFGDLKEGNLAFFFLFVEPGM